MRPRDLSEFVGQGHAIGPDTSLRVAIEQGQPRSMILWGPPGSGKTSLARIVAAPTEAAWTELSAVSAGVKDVRQAIDEAQARLRVSGRRTILFLDEIHRFNKAQQDALLPAVENGWVVLVGATTENPFFELNAPLLSRCELVKLEPLSDGDIRALVRRALADGERGLAGRFELTPDAEDLLVQVADGDARVGLNALEAAATSADPDGVPLDAELLAGALRTLRYDREGDQHYDQVSAFVKSLRGSDPDAAVYWLLRMLEAGEDPRFLARRMAIFASEDIGLADPAALPLAVAAFEALDRVGLPEARHNLVHAAIGLATAPKSNAVARALGAGLHAVEEARNAPVPAHLRDAHYRAARGLGHGVDYDYPHDHPGAYVEQQYLPDRLAGRRLYEPTVHGHEALVAERLAAWRQGGASGEPGERPETGTTDEGSAR